MGETITFKQRWGPIAAVTVASLLIGLATGHGRVVLAGTLFAAGVAAAVVARRTYHITWFESLGLVSCGIQTGFGLIAPVDWPGSTIDRLFTPLLNVIAAFGILTLTIRWARRRGGPFTSTDYLDIGIVTLTGWLTGWIIAADNRGHTAVAFVATVLESVHLPVSMVVVTLTLRIWFVWLRRNRTARLIVGAAILNLAAMVARSAQLSSNTLGFSDLFWLLPSAGSIALLLAAFLQPDRNELSQIPAPEKRTSYHYHEAVLILPIVACLTAPLVLMVLAPTTDPTEVGVRISVVVIGAAMLSIRIVRASAAIHAAETKLWARVDRDELTGLLTRRRLLETLDVLIEESWQTSRTPALVLINVGQVKNLNDMFGGTLGNSVLIALADRISNAFSDTAATIARFSGDDFALVLHQVDGPEHALTAVRALREQISEPIRITDVDIQLSLRFGIAISPFQQTTDAETLFRHAGIAIRHAKAGGRNEIRLFDRAMHQELKERINIETALYGALAGNEMVLFHQPIIDVNSGHVTGFESLMRWNRNGKIIAPGKFIEIAEEAGVIQALGTWAIGEATRQLRTWIDEEVVSPMTTISVNVSPRQLVDPGFAEMVRNTLDQNSLSPHLLWIEVTESTIIDDGALALETMQALRRHGVRIALDDFGTGYSSLSLLQQFPIDSIKIDKSFITRIAERSTERTLVRTIIALADTMSLGVVAEGIETPHQLHAIRELGCDQAQGFLISRPLPAEAIRSTVRAMNGFASLSSAVPRPGPLSAALTSRHPIIGSVHRPLR